MSQIDQYRGGSARTDREVARIADRSYAQVARTAAVAYEESAKLDALGTITVQAMQGVALVSQMEHSLATAVPGASGRLQAIADVHAFTVADLVARLPPAPVVIDLLAVVGLLLDVALLGFAALVARELVQQRRAAQRVRVARLEAEARLRQATLHAMRDMVRVAREGSRG